MSYHAFKEKQHAEFNAFPIGAAFSNEQLEEAKQKLGVKENSELLSIYSGTFIRKVDREAFHALNEKLKQELKDFLKDPENLTDAIRHELGNYEYIYTYDPTDVLNALGFDSYESLTPDQLTCYKKARQQYLATAEA